MENIPAPVERDGRFFCPVEDCTHDGATKRGYASRQAYTQHFTKHHLVSETVAIISRIDYGSPGFREGLLKRAFADAKREGVKFVILAGGLISLPHLKKQLTYQALDALWEEIYGGDYEGEKKPPRAVRVAQARDVLYDSWADDLAAQIPQLEIGGRRIKIYIVTSPAPNYDGAAGAEVARRLTQRRPDILFWGERSVRFSLKYQNKTLWVLVPLKASWRSKYFSTSVDRLIQDEEKQTSYPLPDIWVVGCTASSLQRPSGENARPYVSVPGLCKLQEVHTSENQVGLKVLEFSPQNDEVLERTSSYKDLTANEERWIPDPEVATDLQRKIVAVLKTQPMPIGMFEDALDIPRQEIAPAIEALNESGYRPTIVLDKASGLYGFDPRWIQTELVYPETPSELAEDVIAAFGCLHAGNVNTNYTWYTTEFPRLILKYGATILVGAGDFIEGLKHHLIERGEVLMGLNYTQQERLAARMVGSIILKVFKVLFAKTLNDLGHEPSSEELRTLVTDSLLTFLYNEGNHDEWPADMGVEPLVTFRAALIDYLTDRIEMILDGYGLTLSGLRRLVDGKVVFGETHQLPSGLRITIIHPHLARALTSSLRGQHALDATDTQVVIVANYHVAIHVQQWEAGLGQRDQLQLGAIVARTGYESKRLKTLDVGVGFLRVRSHEERILITEAAFANCEEGEERHTEDFLSAFMDELGI